VNGRLHIDIALGETGAFAVAHSGRVMQRASATVAWPADNEDPSPAIRAAFHALDDSLSALFGSPSVGAHVRVTLLPPLSDARLVPLPPLRPAEAELVIRRDAAKHFVGGAVPRVVAVMPAKGEVLAAAATVAVVEAVRAAATASRWTLDAIVPAHGAWIAAVSGPAANGAAVIVAVEGDAAHIMRLENGAPTGLRRVPATWAGEVAEAAGASPGHALVLAPPDRRSALVAALAAAHWTVSDDEKLAMTAAEAAARCAGISKLELVPPTLAAARRRRTRTIASRMVAVAILLIIAASGIEMWGARRELDVVRARRAAIRDVVAPLLAARDSISRLRDQAGTIANLESTSPRWTRALFDLALLLPADVHLTSLRTNADTLLIEGTGARVAEALQAMRRAGSLTDIRLDGAVQRELEDGETATERFRMRAVLLPPVATAAMLSVPPSRQPVTDAPLRETAGRLP
jgi:hypothetical protein